MLARLRRFATTRLKSQTTPKPLARETLRISFDDGSGIDILRVRDSRARRIKLSVDERGARLTLPLRASDRTGERFIAEHREWLQAQWARISGLQSVPVRRDVTDRLPLRDRDWPLLWQHGRYTALSMQEDTLHFSVAARAGDAAIARALRDFYEAEARADVGRWLSRYLHSLPKAPRLVRFKRMSSQWGSLSPDGSLTLDLSLVLAPPAAFEYVLVHELCHLIHHDHSPRFWREVETRCPEWTAQRDYFREHGRVLKARMRTLLSA